MTAMLSPGKASRSSSTSIAWVARYSEKTRTPPRNSPSAFSRRTPSRNSAALRPRPSRAAASASRVSTATSSPKNALASTPGASSSSCSPA